MWEISEDAGEVAFRVAQNPMHVLCEKWYSRGLIPPIAERIKYLRLAGRPEKELKRIIKGHMHAKKHSEKEQVALDKVFEKFNIKPKKKKVLKPVKKI